MRVEVRTYPSTFAAMAADRASFQGIFAGLLAQEPGLKGRVLDIGAGAAVPSALAQVRPLVGQLDGVDPSPGIARHPHLVERWQGCFETAPLPEGVYDLAYAYNVLEHIAEPRAFFTRLAKILKPGGVFWGLTPHARHPFCWLVRLTERLRLKHRVAESNAAVNDYPAFYRLCSLRTVRRHAAGCGFVQASFHFMPCANWDSYVPRYLRLVPHSYDRLLGRRFGSRMLIFACRLQLGPPS